MSFTIPDKGEGFNDTQSILFQEYLDVLVAGVSGSTCVVSGCAVTAQATPNMTVAVASGVVMSAGAAFTVVGANGTITAADATNPRLDLVVITSAGALAVRAGVAASQPKPAVRVSGDVVLAVVYVPAADAAIESNQITSLRVLNDNVSAFAKTLLDDANQATALTTLGAQLNATVALTAAYTVVAADRGKLFDCSGTFTVTLTAAATLGAGFSFAVRNSGTGVITLDPDLAELVDGVAAITYAAGVSSLVTCNGTAFKTVGLTGGTILQIVSTTTGALATGTTIMPFDDTIPQQTEGDQYMSLAITPKAATSKLRVEVFYSFGTSGGVPSSAIFRDATAAAVGAQASPSTGNGFVSYSVIVSAVSTAATTFKVRIGPSTAATISFNGSAAARLYGGVASSGMVITEIAA